MKLRNKKTGEIKEFDSVRVLKNSDCTIAQFSYDTLAELNAGWEDYKPTEPLIKDEKIRKAVRAWAEACFNDNEFWVIYLGERDFTLKADRSDAKATFYSDNKIDDIEEDEFYTIEELCGEEE